jgi:hypothetical protein
MADHSGLKATIAEMGYLPCTVRDRRSTMNDDEFWEDVSNTLGWNTTPDQLQEAVELDECFGIDAPNPCPECGSVVACGYDSEGRPMIHVIEETDE